MPMQFVAFCPLGDKCGKHGKRLGAFETKDEAINKVVHHLTHSANHDFIEHAEAFDLATNLEYPEEEAWEEPPEQQDKNTTKKGGGKGIKKGGKQEKGGQGWSWGSEQWDAAASSGWRSGPYPASTAMVAATKPGHNMHALGESIAALTRAEASARTASRVARAAALAFEEEAAIMSTVLKKLQDCL